ncbi:DUF3592 domain-containing protein [Blastococcus sp. SYSU DS0619]
MRPTWRRFGEHVDLTGASLVASSVLADGPDGSADLLLDLRDGDPVQLRLRTTDAVELARLLAAGAPAGTAAPEPPPVRRRPPRGWASIAAVVTGALYVGLYVVMAVTGYSATATVTGGSGDGFCDVVWEDDPGRQHSGEASCSDESTGSTIDVLVSGWPFPEEAITPGDFVLETLVVGIPLCGLGGVRLLFVRRRAVRWRRDLASPSSPGTAEASPCAAEAAATNRALASSRRWTAAFFAVGILSITGFVVGTSVVFDQSAELRESGVQAAGTVEEVRPGRALTTGTALVRYTVDGVERYGTVALGDSTDLYSEDQTVTVYYDAADPGRMTIDDQDNQPSWSVLLMVLALVGGLGILWLAGHRSVRGLVIERLLWSRPWQRVRADVEFHGAGLVVRLDDGSVWRSQRWSGWRRREPAEERTSLPGDTALPGDEQADADDRSVWWVDDGTRAVFAPDRGGPLVLTRRSR